MLFTCETAVATVLACEKDTSNVLVDSASYEYDDALRLSVVTNYDVTSGDVLYTVSYTYDENGNRLNVNTVVSDGSLRCGYIALAKQAYRYW